MQLNITTDYVIRIVLFLGLEKKTVASREISELMNIPQTYILKLLKIMEKAGIVSIERGVYGGACLKNYEATLLDIMKLTEAKMKISPCLETDRYCGCMASIYCPVCKVYEEVQSDIDKKLGSIKLSDLIAQSQPRCNI